MIQSMGGNCDERCFVSTVATIKSSSLFLSQILVRVRYWCLQVEEDSALSTFLLLTSLLRATQLCVW